MQKTDYSILGFGITEIAFKGETKPIFKFLTLRYNKIKS